MPGEWLEEARKRLRGAQTLPAAPPEPTPMSQPDADGGSWLQEARQRLRTQPTGTGTIDRLPTGLLDYLESLEIPETPPPAPEQPNAPGLLARASDAFKRITTLPKADEDVTGPAPAFPGTSPVEQPASYLPQMDTRQFRPEAGAPAIPTRPAQSQSLAERLAQAVGGYRQRQGQAAEQQVAADPTTGPLQRLTGESLEQQVDTARKATTQGRVQSSFQAGMGQAAQLTGTGLEALGLGGVVSEALRIEGERKAKKFDVPVAEWKGPKSLLDPKYWTTSIPRMAGTSAPLMALGAALTVGGAAAAGAAGLGAIGAGITGTVGAATISRYLEGLMEAGGVFEEAKARGMTDEQARAAARKTLINNMKLTGVDAVQFGMAFLKFPKPLQKVVGKAIGNAMGKVGIGIAKVLGGAASEGAEEVVQEAISAGALGDKFDLTGPAAQEAFAGGALMGGVFQAGGLATRAGEQPAVPPAPPDSGATVPALPAQPALPATPAPVETPAEAGPVAAPTAPELSTVRPAKTLTEMTDSELQRLAEQLAANRSRIQARLEESGPKRSSETSMRQTIGYIDADLRTVEGLLAQRLAGAPATPAPATPQTPAEAGLVAAPAKEPWQMTREEYRQEVIPLTRRVYEQEVERSPSEFPEAAKLLIEQYGGFGRTPEEQAQVSRALGYTQEQAEEHARMVRLLGGGLLSGDDYADIGQPEQDPSGGWADDHYRAIVQKAIAQGLPVPDEVRTEAAAAETAAPAVSRQEPQAVPEGQGQTPKPPSEPVTPGTGTQAQKPGQPDIPTQRAFAQRLQERFGGQYQDASDPETTLPVKITLSPESGKVTVQVGTGAGGGMLSATEAEIEDGALLVRGLVRPEDRTAPPGRPAAGDKVQLQGVEYTVGGYSPNKQRALLIEREETAPGKINERFRVVPIGELPGQGQATETPVQTTAAATPAGESAAPDELPSVRLVRNLPGDKAKAMAPDLAQAAEKRNKELKKVAQGGGSFRVARGFFAQQDNREPIFVINAGGSVYNTPDPSWVEIKTADPYDRIYVLPEPKTAKPTTSSAAQAQPAQPPAPAPAEGEAPAFAKGDKVRVRANNGKLSTQTYTVSAVDRDGVTVRGQTGKPYKVPLARVAAVAESAPAAEPPRPAAAVTTEPGGLPEGYTLRNPPAGFSKEQQRYLVSELLKTRAELEGEPLSTKSRLLKPPTAAGIQGKRSGPIGATPEGETIRIKIPGDGTFTIKKTPEAIDTMLERVGLVAPREQSLPAEWVRFANRAKMLAVAPAEEGGFWITDNAMAERVDEKPTQTKGLTAMQEWGRLPDKFSGVLRAAQKAEPIEGRGTFLPKLQEDKEDVATRVFATPDGGIVAINEDYAKRADKQGYGYAVAKTREFGGIVVLQKDGQVQGFVLPAQLPDTKMESASQALGMEKAGKRAGRQGDQLLSTAARMDDLAQGGQPREVSRAEVLKSVSKLLKLPVHTGRYPFALKGALGVYKHFQQVVRTKRAEDLPVVAHELGHHFDKLFGLSESGDYDAELFTLAEALYGSEAMQEATADYKRREGVAEFGRAWFTNPAKAERMAPEFAEAFEEAVNGDDLGPAIRQVRQVFLDYYAQNPEQLAAASISWGPEKEPWSLQRAKKAAAEGLRRAYAGMIDELDPLRVHQETFMQAWKARGWRGMAQSLISGDKKGRAVINGADVGPSLTAILNPVTRSAKQARDFGTYSVARRVLYLAKSRSWGDDRLPMPVKVAEETAQKLGNPLFERAFTDLQAFQDSVLNFYAASGMLSKAQVKAIREANEEYVPFRRLAREEGMGGAGKAGSGKKMANLGQAVKRMKGGSGTVINPLESVVRNTFTMVHLAERNRATAMLADWADGTEGIGWLIEKVPPDQMAVTLSEDELAKTLAAAGVDEEAIKEAREYLEKVKRLAYLEKQESKRALTPKQETELEGLREWAEEGEAPDVDLSAKATLFRAYMFPTAKASSEGILMVWRGGKPTFYQVKDPVLYRGMLMLDSETLPMWAKLLRPASRMLREFATITFEFMGRNVGRDALTAAVYGRGMPFEAITRGVADILGGQKWLYDWQSSGGANNTVAAVDRNYLQRELNKILAHRTMGLRKYLTTPWDAMRQVSELFEQATRVGEYQMASTGKSALQTILRRAPRPVGRTAAVVESRDVTIDFLRSGPWGRTYNQVSAFFNAAVQDLDKFHRSFLSKRTPPQEKVKRLARALTFITLPTVLLHMLNRDDEDYKKLPQWRKDLFWNIPAGGGHFIPFPIPHLLGLVFKVAPERMLTFADTREPEALYKGLGKTVGATALPNLLPTAVALLMELGFNYSLFHERPIVPRSEEGLEPALQFGPGTSETAKAIGKIANTSPRKVEHAVRGVTGGSGAHAFDAADWLLSKTGLVDTPTPSRDETPVLSRLERAFYLDAAEAGSDAAERFYDTLGRAETLWKSVPRRAEVYKPLGEMSTWTAAERERFSREMARLSAKERQLLSATSYLRSEASKLSKLRRQQRLIEMSRTMSTETKKREIERIRGMVDTIVQRAATRIAGKK